MTVTPLEKVDLETLFNKTFIPIRHNLDLGEAMRDAEGRRWILDAREEVVEENGVVYMFRHGEYYAFITVVERPDEKLEVQYEIRLKGAEDVGGESKNSA